MSKKSQSFLSQIYGDYWAKEKQLILYNFFMPLLFSIVTFLFYYYYRSPDLNIYEYYNNILFKYAINKFHMFYIISIILIVLISFSIYNFMHISHIEALQRTYEEIYVQLNVHQRGILLKNLAFRAVYGWKWMLPIVVYLLINSILGLLGLYPGYIGYLYINFYAVEHLLNIVQKTPFVGGQIKEIIIYLTSETTQELFGFFTNVPVNVKLLILLFAICLFFPLVNTIECNIMKKQKGNISNIFLNGSMTMFRGLNLPRKLGSFFYRTFLCLLGNQNLYSVNIPITRDRNIDDAINSVLGDGYNNYVTRMPLISLKEDLANELNNLPEEIQDQIKEQYKSSLNFSDTTKQVMKDIYEKTIVNESLMKSFVVYGINEAGCLIYALVTVPPPTQMSRMISTLWCNDPIIKDRIISEIHQLE